MRILAIESSAVTASVAILEDDTLVAEYTINHEMTHSQTLLPMIDEIFSMVQLKPDDVDVIAHRKLPYFFHQRVSMCRNGTNRRFRVFIRT